MESPRTVTAEQFWTAAKPLLDLLGMVPQHCFAKDAQLIPDENGRIRFFKALASGDQAHHLFSKVGDDPYFAEWAHDVTIRVDHTDQVAVLARLWPDVERTPGYRVLHGRPYVLADGTVA